MVRSAATGDDLVMGRWLDVTMVVVAKPGIAEVTCWLAAPNVLVAVDEADILRSGELVGNLEFSMYPGLNLFFRGHKLMDWSV